MKASISDFVKPEAADAFIEFHNRQHEQKNMVPVTPPANLSIEPSKYDGFVSLAVDMDYGDDRFVPFVNVFFTFISGWNASQDHSRNARIEALVNG